LLTPQVVELRRFGPLLLALLFGLVGGPQARLDRRGSLTLGKGKKGIAVAVAIR
jgi:hypothetical protein